MSERNGYRAGVPCWVDTFRADPDGAAGFYSELFGWETESRIAADSTQKYFVCKLRGRDVAAISSQPSKDVSSDWNTYIWVDGVDDVAAKVVEAGGTIAVEPFGSFDGGRMAVLADHGGAALGVWEPGAHRGAQLVNEPGAWAMSMLRTHDVEGSKRFYGTVFGWDTETFDAGEGEPTMWKLPGYVGGEPEQPVPRDVVAVMVPITGESVPGDEVPHWGVNFWVNDADAIAARAAELGGAVVAPPSDTPGFREAVIADPQGAALSVSQRIAES